MNLASDRIFHQRAIFIAPCIALLFCACVSAPYEQLSAPPAPDLAGTHWTVTRIDGQDTLSGPELTADFSVDGRVNGDSGCNSFSGPFVQTGANVSFGELLSTRRACIETNRQRQEERMLNIMSGGTTVRLARDGGELRLRSSAGTMTFERVALKDDGAVAPRTVRYDCQGVPLTVVYGDEVVRLSWPDGNDVLRLTSSRSNSRVTRYESRYSDLRIERDVLWGREGGNPRSCIEKR